MKLASLKGICLILLVATLSGCISHETIRIERREGEVTYYASISPGSMAEAPGWGGGSPEIHLVSHGSISRVVQGKEPVYRFKAETIQIHRTRGFAVFPVASKGEGR